MALGGALLAATGLVQAAAFAPGNLVVYRIGDGTATLSGNGNAVFLDEYTTAGSLVQSIPMPTTTSGAQRQLIASGTATSEGLLTRSADGACLVLTGYARDLGIASSVSGATSVTVPRVIGLVSAAGVADTSTALTDFSSANNVRGAVATSCTGQLWVTGGATGISAATLGATTSTQISTTITNLRQPIIASGQLFVSTGSGSTVRIGAVGTGLPTTSGQTIINLPSFPSGTGGPYGFAFADLDAGVAGNDTLYVADDTAQALRKYSLVAGAWTLNGTVGVDADDYRGITIAVSGSTVTIFATRANTTLVSLVDASGYNGAFSGTPTTLVTAGTNQVFRGVAFAPVALSGNAAPTITAATGLSRQQGSPVSNSTIATVTDDAGASTVVVTGAATINGITLSNIVNTAGTVTGDLIASCTATNAAFTLTATDAGSLTATSTLNVAAAANTAPVQGTYSNATLLAGAGTTINPSAAPTDNGSIASITATAPGFAGTATVNTATGVVTIGNAGPASVTPYAFTVTATDNCGATSTRNFSLTVNAPNAAPTITAATGLSRQQGSPVSNSVIANVTDDAGNGSVSVTVNGGASATVNGVTLSNIVNAKGSVSADLIASCTATAASFTLTATDAGSLAATSTLNVAAAANTAPVQGTYANTTLTAGGGTTVNASAAPTDNGSVSTVTVAASGSPAFTGTVSVNPSTGNVTISNAGPAGTYTVTVTATDNCNATSTSSFQLTVNAANAAPTITAASGLSRQQGSPVSNSTIATVTDDAGAGTVTVTGASTVNGITLSNIVNTAGTVTGDLIASCTATNAAFTLTATDAGNLTATSTLNVAAPANTAPVQGTYANTTLTAGGGTTVNASAAPTDNGSVSTVTVAASGSSAFTGTVSVNPSTGNVTISNAGPAGTYTVTVTATDNCNTTSTSSFQLTVNAANAAPTITAASGLSRQQGSPVSNSTIATVTDDAGAGTVTVTGASTVNGITLSNIVNTVGTITGNLIASCTATAASFTLTATDAGNLTATSTLNVAAPANTAPVQGTYANTTLTAGGGTTVNASAAPTDNGSVSTVTVAASGSPAFTGTVSVNPSTGNVTISNAGPAGTYTVTVTATDNCNATSTSSFQLTVNAANAAPTITAATGLSRQQGSPVSNSTIANVTDDGGNGSVAVTVNGGASATVNGITLSNIVNSAGTVAANLIASCSASNAAFTLTATDGGSLTATSTLNVNVIANTPPTQGSYANTVLTAGGSTTVTPSAAPSDNGSITSVTVSAPGLSTAPTVNPSTGVVSITNADPPAVYTVTVTAADNCFLASNRAPAGTPVTSTSSFQLTVNASSGGDPVITPVGITRAQGAPNYRSVIANVTNAGGAGNVTVTAVPATGSGVVLTGIQNNNGVISALVRAGCFATTSTFTLTANNGSNSNVGTLTVTVTPGSNPTWCAWWPR